MHSRHSLLTLSLTAPTSCFLLHKLEVTFYGGTSTIIPLPLAIFRKMLEDSRRADYTPQPSKVREFFEFSNTVAANSANETEWYGQITEKALDWLS